MSARKKINQMLEPLTGHEINKVCFGTDLWRDIKTILGREAAAVFDVGANEGQSAHEFLRHFPKAQIYSFEPIPEAFAVLRRMAESQPRIRAVNKALGENPGQAEFCENAFQQTSSFLPAAVDSKNYFGANVLGCRKKIEVELTTLDAFCRAESIEKIDLLKIDVQGFELSVLKGAPACLAGGKIGCIALEINFVPLYENQAAIADLIALLKTSKYHLAAFYDFAWSPRKELMWCDALFHWCG